MHKPAFLALAMLAGAAALVQPAMAQSATNRAAASRHARPAAGAAQRPVDHGPFTPDASSAYQGGGVVLQGAPGAPAPVPQATPPGQVPQNMVPAR